MTWREDLQPASFRGVPFEVEEDEAIFGRRVNVNEYPQRDLPNTEDMGRKARLKNLVGFVIGDDYMTRRNNLLDALDKPGSGELIHPYYGRLTVTVSGDVRVTHTRAEGGMCRFNISFVETGEVAYPTASNAAGSQTKQAADALEEAAKEDFSDTFTVDGLPDFAVQDAITSMKGVLDGLEDRLTSVGGILADPLSALKAALPAAVQDPLGLANQVFGLFSKTASVIDSASGLRDITALNFLRAFTTLRSTSLFDSSFGDSRTPTRAVMAANNTAINTLVRQALITQTAGMTSSMPLPVYDDAVKLRSELLDKVDFEIYFANDVTYLALVDLRASVHSDMTDKIQNAARLQDYQQKEVLPALVVSYELYGNVSRENEIIQRNRLRHPGFTPAEKLKVLSV